MICRYCSQSVPGSGTVCPHCGRSLTDNQNTPDVFRMRQGKQIRVESYAGGSQRERGEEALLPDAPIASERRLRGQKYARDMQDAGKPQSRRGLMQDASVKPGMNRRQEKKSTKPSAINWTLIWLIVIVLCIFSVMGGLLYLRLSDP